MIKFLSKPALHRISYEVCQIKAVQAIIYVH